ncbi:hypothetical protein PENARI_c056G00788 [Penicillium arizonense]|uniref:Uncharacterized protein n=1 Tax=Penicillium arizonense TaxID=1835702 RepID=A0A1F5L2C2_PENAI|nr:hypothetical protein PENARI_c056G00788 [Penicillium arizonense]OGE47187.1 hypothetical protein PENARI_c056G00788 [Penicillium arizonense]
MEPEPIAIIGTACRFAGDTSTPAKLWDLLNSPSDVASRPPTDRFNLDGFYDPDGSNPATTNVKESYFINDSVKQFDAPFFNLSVDEANALDPQQRILLEVVYESLESAGICLERLRGSPTGVFCGVMTSDFENILAGGPEMPLYGAVGVSRNNLANRISYFFDWRGPSMSIDTACSSSLVALHQAVAALRQGECNVATALGVNLLLSPHMFVAFSNMQMLSPSGRCLMWDADADGYARGEGVASVVLKRLSDAVADGDQIDCVIRATGTNQDGRSMGITMPSSAAQVQLIRSTYALAGLNVECPDERPQYFEAHGTGTKAGDPQEAAAIHQVFFGTSSTATLDPLHVGSIKTIVGHTEGTAGLAGILKAYLCIKHGQITPNLHFNRLNPELEPFANHLLVPTKSISWPKLGPGVPRRVSVNSFGFGGSNCHAILESYGLDRSDSGSVHTLSLREEATAVLPFMFSAASEESLVKVLDRYINYLQTRRHIDPVDLAWSMFERRSALSHRLSLWAPNIDELQTRLRDELDQRKASPPATLISRPTPREGRKRVLGIFTGQGAQWPQMGLELISKSPAAQAWLNQLQDSLDTLPVEYRPTSTMLKELSAESPISRLHEAAVCQPLCTAIQIILINVLQTLGVSFHTVVGHSSGEIAAAYAAGVLTSHDAIRIAHLRGLVAVHAGSNGRQGGMLATGLSMSEALDLCSEATFFGRIAIAACNSPSSVTISGDADGIQQAEQHLKDRGKFARTLHVDTAYHSHHMQPCLDRYMQALGVCNIKPRKPKSSTFWYSSVYQGGVTHGETECTGLSGQYWADNMVNPVLFCQALTEAINRHEASIDLTVEVGPHPALKGPVQQTITETASNCTEAPPYVSLANRKMGGIEAVARAIGTLRDHLGSDAVNVSQYLALFYPSKNPSFITDLPLYPFDYGQSYCYEPREVKERLQRSIPPNSLLGSRSSGTAGGEWHWRHSLSPQRIEWLDNHQLESNTRFPDTGYIAMALEAVAQIAPGRPLRVVTMHHITIHHAIAFVGHEETVEANCHLHQEESTEDTMLVAFTCEAAIEGKMTKCASGQLNVVWGTPDMCLLPLRTPAIAETIPVKIDEFYSSLSRIGYNFKGLFRGLASLERTVDMSRGLLKNASGLMLLHPAIMETSLQGILGAIGAPGDGQLSSIYVPNYIETVTINPAFLGPATLETAGSLLSFDAILTEFSCDATAGDVEIFGSNGHGFAQLEGIHISPLRPPSPSDDRPIFQEFAWGPLHPDANSLSKFFTTDTTSNIMVGDHVAFLILKDTISQLKDVDRQNLGSHQSRVVAWIDHVMALTQAGIHPVCRMEWLKEGNEERISLQRQLQPVFSEIMDAVRLNLLGFLRGQTSMLQVLRDGDLLTRFYSQEDELRVANEIMGRYMKQLTFRYPSMKILEIGGGTGSATHAVLEHVGRSYHSYTFTDISAGFFEDAQHSLVHHDDRFIYKVLDIEKDIGQQGFEERAYDLILASNVIHATRQIEKSLHNIRKLLKPGGYLIALEVTNVDIIRISTLMSGFEGWWLGAEYGRPWGPMLGTAEWDTLLQRTGFGGIDNSLSTHNSPLAAYSVFVAQAIDERMQLLRQPLTTHATSPAKGSLVLVGGVLENTRRVLADSRTLLEPYFDQITHFPTLDAMGAHPPARQEAVLIAVDMDQPCFQAVTKDTLRVLKAIFQTARCLLWITVGSEASNPYIGMSRRFVRSLNHEQPHTIPQCLNIVDPDLVHAELLATSMMRLVHTTFYNDYRMRSRVHSTELELRLDGNILMIPRLVESSSRNMRRAAMRRAVYDKVDPQQSAVKLTTRAGPSYELVVQAPQRSCQRPCIQLQVHYSTSHAVHIPPVGFLTLALGRDVQTGASFITMTDKHSSIITVPKDWCCETPGTISSSDEAGFLYRTASALLADHLTQRTFPKSSLLIHEADDILRHMTWIQGTARGIHICFSTSKESESAGSFPPVSFVHAMSATRVISQLVPCNTSLAVNLDSSYTGAFSKMVSCLPSSARVEQFSTLFRRSPELHSPVNLDDSARLLHTACAMAIRISHSNHRPTIVDIKEVPALDNQFEHALKIVHWKRTGELRVRQLPASYQVALSPTKTYLLVGMTSEVGRSVCRCMFSMGARHMVLSSRDPKTDSDSQWIDQMTAQGARVALMTIDVTSSESALAVDQFIRQNFPPVGGVVNGETAFQDKVPTPTDLKLAECELQPHVPGSLLLEELYGNDDLDFFILFGSALFILDSIRHSLHDAATLFMANLIQSRRKHNLVGSIIRVVGLGHDSLVPSEPLELSKKELGSHVLSERDIHEIFAEAILAGRPTFGQDPEVIAGLNKHNPTDHPNLPWYRSPSLWHLIDYHAQFNRAPTPSPNIQTREQLSLATCMDDIVQIVLRGFSAKISDRLHLSNRDMVTPEMSLADLGADSLVAVALLMWFRKELDVNVPMLQILGGASIREIAEDISRKIPAGLYPKFPRV